MELNLLNPAGLWLLGGCLVVVGIHLIQQRFKQRPISTLFLLGEVQESTAKAKRLNWLRNSWLFWLQLLLAALVAFLYCQPYLLGLSGKAKVVFVVDGSFSMFASKERLLSEIDESVSEILGKVEGGKLLLFDTESLRVLYDGESISSMKGVLQSWRPSQAKFDVIKALREVRDLHSEADHFIYLSDHRQEVPENWNLLSFGNEIDNWGLSGFSIEESSTRPNFHSFSGIVKNFGAKADERNWWLEVDGEKASMGRVRLEPGQLANLKADVSSLAKKVVVAIDKDEFQFDDQLPFVIPRPQNLKVYLERGKFSSGLRKLVSSLPNISRVNRAENADFSIKTFQAESSRKLDSAIALYSGNSKTGRPQSVVSEESRLTSHLSFSGLWVSTLAKYQKSESDRVLIWADDVPAVFLRTWKGSTGMQEQLVINFDLRYSNALSHPAFVLMFGRYIEQRRSDSNEDIMANFDSGVSLRPLLKSIAGESEMIVFGLTREEEFQLQNSYKIPSEPSFFSFKTADQYTISGASQIPTMGESLFLGFGGYAKRANNIEEFSKAEGVVKELGTAGLLLALLLALLTWFLSETGSRGFSPKFNFSKSSLVEPTSQSRSL